MNFKFHISFFKIALCIGAIFLLLSPALAQKGIIELLPGTEKLIYDEKIGAQKFVGGGVNLNYEGNKIYADVIYYYEKKNKVKAVGNVHINKNDSLNLYCDSLTYFTDQKNAKLYSRVRVMDNEYKLTTQALDYDAKTGVGVYQNYGKIENILSNEVLTSKRGYMYPNEKNFHFSQEVKYRSDSLSMDTDTLQYQFVKKKIFFFGPTVIKTPDTDMFCYKGWYQTQTKEGVLENQAFISQKDKKICGDSLYIHETNRIAEARKNVHFIDTTNGMEFLANHAYFSENDHYGFITDSVTIIYPMKDDTLYIHSDSVLVFSDSLNKIERAELFWDVQIYGTKIQASCDSLTLNKPLEKITLFNQPLMWSQNAELKADSMYVYINDSVIKKVDLIQKSTVIMELDSGNYYNQAGGKIIQAFFTNNELKRVEINQNAQTNFYPQDTLRSDTLVEIQRKGMTRLYASNLKIYLDSGEVIGVTYFGNPDGAFHPIPLIPKEEQFIQNFSFSPQFKPLSRRDIFRQKRYFKSNLASQDSKK